MGHELASQEEDITHIVPERQLRIACLRAYPQKLYIDLHHHCIQRYPSHLAISAAYHHLYLASRGSTRAPLENRAYWALPRLHSWRSPHPSARLLYFVNLLANVTSSKTFATFGRTQLARIGTSILQSESTSHCALEPPTVHLNRRKGRLTGLACLLQQSSGLALKPVVRHSNK